MEKIEKWICTRLSADNGLLKKSFLFTYLWGLIAHGYLFLSNSITHDSIDEFINTAEMIAVKFSRGRLFACLIYGLRGPISAPWWLGLWMLLWLSLAVYLVLRLFAIKQTWLVCLTSGIMTVNISMISLVATYIHDVDCYAAAAFMAVLAVWLWRKGSFLGLLPVTAVLGLYQGYLSLTITLVVMLSMLDLRPGGGKQWKEVFCSGLQGAAMVVVGALLYLALLKLVPALLNIELATEDYNTLDSILKLTPLKIGELIGSTWVNTVFCFLTVVSGVPLYLNVLVQGSLLLICAVCILGWVFDKNLGLGEKILLAVLALSLPVCMDISRILSGGMSHDLMHYAMWLVYLLVLALPRKKEWFRILAAALVCLTLVSGVRTANVIYTAKRFMTDANRSFFTRIITDLEDQEGYIAGQTPISFIGEPGLGLKALPEQYERYYTTGFDTSFAIGTPIRDHYQYYFDYVLMYPGIVAEDEVTESFIWRQEVLDMPEYPQPGSIAMLDGVMVVKLGQYR